MNCEDAMKYASRYRGLTLGMTQATKGALTEGILGAALGLGGVAIISGKEAPLPTEDKIVAYGLTIAGGLIFMDALGVNVLKEIGL